MTRKHFHTEKPVRLPRCTYSVRTEDDLFGVFGPEMIEDTEVFAVIRKDRHVRPRQPWLKIAGALYETSPD